MATKGRKNISASLRWQVFARDGFRCRYCGTQAGEPGVTLHADHVVSVADGGTNAFDNLRLMDGGDHSRLHRKLDTHARNRDQHGRFAPGKGVQNASK
jgi:5-methylcytosine-specific restriction endonuclease McrA